MNATTQKITPELRDWIVAQAQAGIKPEEVLTAMLNSGWQEDVAAAAMEETLRNYLVEHAKSNGLPMPGNVPEPDLAHSPNSVIVHGHEVKVLLTMRNPRVVVFGGLFSEAECDQMIELARPRLTRSETLDNATGGNEVNEARTSHGMFFDRGESPLIAKLEQRIATLVNWPVTHGEGFQVLRYAPGAQYRPHYDYFDPGNPGGQAVLKRGGNRVGTLVMYLNTVPKGGSTIFPDSLLEVAPVKGNAVFFSYDRPHPLTKTLHGGSPVIEGEKWVATKWLRERVFA